MAIGSPVHPDAAGDAAGSPTRRWLQSPHAGHLSGLVWGGGPASVVLVHDRAGEASDWAAVAAALELDVVAIDLPGHGRSSASSERQNPARTALAVVDAVWSCAPGAALVVGVGAGAELAVAAARRRPDRVRAVGVVGAAHPVLQPDQLEGLAVPLVVIGTPTVVPADIAAREDVTVVAGPDDLTGSPTETAAAIRTAHTRVTEEQQ
jgi:pimeloyl-ACP methyl ester carboxylesterase